MNREAHFMRLDTADVVALFHKKKSGRGLVGRRVRIAGSRSIRKIIAVYARGEVRINHPLAGLRWWHIGELRFVRRRA